MTGFGQSYSQMAGIHLTVEILSVNRKHLDINLVMPKHLYRFDPEIRKLLSSYILRGHVTVRIGVVFTEEAPLEVQANVAMAKQYYQGWMQIIEALELDKKAFSLSLLEKETDLFSYKETKRMELFSEFLFQGIKKALEPFMVMRQVEGERLKQDILGRLAKIHGFINSVSISSLDAVERYREKLIEKMKMYLPLTDATDERVLKEVVLFAEKVDIAEELVRFSSHIDQFYDLFKKEVETVGKTVEFLVQELGREINTIGSKCQELSITRLVIEIKAELERIREQIQNIE